MTRNFRSSAKKRVRFVNSMILAIAFILIGFMTVKKMIFDYCQRAFKKNDLL